MNHDDTDEDAQDRVTAKTLDRAVHNQDRQVVERGGDNGKEACEVLEELAVIGEAAFHAKEAVGNDQRLKADDDCSADEGGNDGDKNLPFLSASAPLTSEALISLTPVRAINSS